jgi:very-short-patch-repair endonuclease
MRAYRNPVRSPEFLETWLAACFFGATDAYLRAVEQVDHRAARDKTCRQVAPPRLTHHALLRPVTSRRLAGFLDVCLEITLRKVVAFYCRTHKMVVSLMC